MSEADVEQELAALRGALAGKLDEEIVCAQWFRPPGWGSTFKGLARSLGRLVPGSKEPQKLLGAMNVMALTPTRVVAHRLSTGAGGMRAGKKVGEWPLGELSIGSKGHKVETSKSHPDPAISHTYTTTEMILVSLRAPDGQPLLLEGDFPKSALTRQLVESIKQAVL